MTLPAAFRALCRHHRILSLIAAAMFAGCASRGGQAPVEERSVAPRAPAPVSPPSGAVAATAATAPSPAAPVAEPVQRPGTYTVKPGDTLIRIGLDHGQPWRDIARWNNIDNPNRIEVGQVLQVAPVLAESGAVTRPVLPAGRTTPEAAATAAAASPGAVAASAPAALATPPAAIGSDEDLGWAWPAVGPVASGFEEGKTKGLAITGKAGDPVLAAADGRVVYAGSGLRGYGNLIIVKHNNTYLTAYAHNQALLVKEDQAVRRGQRIAEMGSSDAERVQLHFEIRRQGKPVDPAKLLPPR